MGNFTYNLLQVVAGWSVENDSITWLQTVQLCSATEIAQIFLKHSQTLISIAQNKVQGRFMLPNKQISKVDAGALGNWLYLYFW